MINQQTIEAFGEHRAMTLTAYVAKTVANLSQGESVNVEHVKLLNGLQTTDKQLHAACRRATPPGHIFNIRTDANGVAIYRTC